MSMKKESHKEGKPSELHQVIVETPRGSRNKYKFDNKTGRIKLSKVLPEGMVFPYDFGFFPATRAADGDPLDVLVLSDEPMFPGCQVDCRLIGVIKATQREKGKESANDRIVAVAAGSVLYASIEQLSDLEPGVLAQIEAFFSNYQKVRNIEFKVLGRAGPHSAQELVEQAMRAAAA
jgi:inorganic pyrophosphatase